jgi:predicted nucleic acid-binding protein
VDTNVISWMFDERPNPLAERYRRLIGPRPVVLSFQSVMELRYRALRAAGESCAAGAWSAGSHPSLSSSPTTGC